MKTYAHKRKKALRAWDYQLQCALSSADATGSARHEGNTRCQEPTCHVALINQELSWAKWAIREIYGEERARPWADGDGATLSTIEFLRNGTLSGLPWESSFRWTEMLKAAWRTRTQPFATLEACAWHPEQLIDHIVTHAPPYMLSRWGLHGTAETIQQQLARTRCKSGQPFLFLCGTALSDIWEDAVFFEDIAQVYRHLGRVRNEGILRPAHDPTCPTTDDDEAHTAFAIMDQTYAWLYCDGGGSAPPSAQPGTDDMCIVRRRISAILARYPRLSRLLTS